MLLWSTNEMFFCLAIELCQNFEVKLVRHTEYSNFVSFVNFWCSSLSTEQIYYVCLSYKRTHKTTSNTKLAVCTLYKVPTVQWKWQNICIVYIVWHEWLNRSDIWCSDAQLQWQSILTLSRCILTAFSPIYSIWNFEFNTKIIYSVNM